MERINFIKSPSSTIDNRSIDFIRNRENNLNLVYSLIRKENGASKNDLKFLGYNNNKKEIRNLAKGCCAYCGIRIYGNAVTVEHYRPKAKLNFLSNNYKYHQFNLPLASRTNNFNQKSEVCEYAYFLWGDDFRNLLPACEGCNTGQDKLPTYITKNRDESNLENKIPYGKRTFFPLYFEKNKDPRCNLFYVSNISSEIPLLFNPYLDDPLSLFSYEEPISTKDGWIIKIKPNLTASKINKLRAKSSIMLLGLNRFSLCHRRYNNYQLIKKLTDELEKVNPYHEEEWANLIKSYTNLFNRDSQEFIGYSKYLIGNIVYDLKENTQRIHHHHFSNSNDFDVIIGELIIFHETIITRQKKQNLNSQINSAISRLNTL